MKIRTDFVTNSSSSSFIVSYNSDDELNNMPSYIEDYYKERIIDDVRNNIKTLEDVMDFYKDNIDTWNLRFKNKELWRYDYKERCDKNSEVYKFVEAYKEEQTNKMRKTLEEYKNLSIVEYADDCGESELEHEILPYLDFVIRRISHH